MKLHAHHRTPEGSNVTVGAFVRQSATAKHEWMLALGIADDEITIGRFTPQELRSLAIALTRIAKRVSESTDENDNPEQTCFVL